MRQKKDINVKVGAGIQNARENAGLTQDQLSEMIGVSPNHLSAVERGVYGISLENLQKICNLLNVSADYIIFGNSPNSDALAIAKRIQDTDPRYKEHILKGLNILLEMTEIRPK